MQWTLGLVSVIFMWIIGFPAAWYASAKTKASMDTIDPDNDGTDALLTAWRCIPPAYIAINLVLFACFIKADWHEIREQIRQREGMVDDEPNPNEGSAKEGSLTS